MTQDEQKRAVAQAALQYVVDDAWIGVGSGSTANLFIDALAARKHRIKGTVASSVKTAERLRSHGILVEELTIASLVQTVAENIPGVTRIKILVEGKERETLAGHADLTTFYDVSVVSQLAGQLAEKQ